MLEPCSRQDSTWMSGGTGDARYVRAGLVRGRRRLCRDDVETITANPKTAGVARWNFLALWGAHMARGHQAALDYTKKACRPAGIPPPCPLLPLFVS